MSLINTKNHKGIWSQNRWIPSRIAIFKYRKILHWAKDNIPLGKESGFGRRYESSIPEQLITLVEIIRIRGN